MKTTPTRRSGSATSLQPDLFPQATLTSNPSPTCGPTTCADTCSVTSSPASADGPAPPVSPDGRTIGRYGVARALARAKAFLARNLEQRTIDISGPLGIRSLPNAAPLSSWENRLRERLARIGSTECALTWKAAATPCKRRLYRLVPSMRRIDGTDFGLWPTVTASDHKSRSASQATLDRNARPLREVLYATVRDTSSLNVPTENGAGSLHPEFGGWEMGYPPEWLSCAPSVTRSIRALARKS